MDELYQSLFEKGRVGKVLEVLRKPGLPDPARDPRRALLYGHALWFYGDFQNALQVYSSIPPEPSWDAERLWGLANAHLRLGNLKEAQSLLDEALPLTSAHPEREWLLTLLYNLLAILYIYRGEFEPALRAIEKGIEAAQKGSHLTQQLVLEGNRGLVEIYQGAYAEALLIIEKVVKQMLDRDCILFAAIVLTNLSGLFETLGVRNEALKSLSRAEGLIQRSGSKGRLITLKQVQGNLLEREGFLDKAEQTYREALELLQGLPNPTAEIQIAVHLAHIRFEKGDLSAALTLIRQASLQVGEKGFHFLEDICLTYEGKFLLHAGAIEEGVAVLNRARDVVERSKKWETYPFLALYLAWGYDHLKDKIKALEWLRQCLVATERRNTLPALLIEREVLTSLLLKLGEDLPPGEFLSKLIIQLRHPTLLKRALKRSPEGKAMFLRALKVHDARHFLPQLAKLKNDPQKEVRQTSRVLLNGWRQHVGYRVYALGTLRTFLEGKMFADKDWIRPSVKRLFLFLVTQPDEWHTTDSLLEALWPGPHPEKRRNALNNLFYRLREVFEPWSRLAGDYVFFPSQRGAYGFFPGERFWIDAKEFQEGIQRAEKAQRDRNFKEARQAYRQALELYLGDYLEEFPYEDWLNPKRDYLRELYFRGVMRYAALERDSGNLSEARRVLEDALFKDLSRSGCAAFLMQVLVQMKLTQEARELGLRHIKYLKEEMKEKPAPEVVEALAKLG